MNRDREGNLYAWCKNCDRARRLKRLADGKEFSYSCETCKTLYAGGKKFTIQSKGTLKNGKLDGEGSTAMFDEDGVKVMEEKGNFNAGALNGEGEVTEYSDDGGKKRAERGYFRCGILKEGEVLDFANDATERVKRKKEEIRSILS